MKKVTAKNIHDFIKLVKEMEKKGYIMVGVPISGRGGYACIMTENYKMSEK